MGRRLEIGGSLQRELACLEPIGDRLIVDAGDGVVVRQGLRLGLDDFLELRLQRRGDLGMHLLPPAFQQALIGRVPHKRMLERVGRFRRDAASKNELGFFQLLHDVLQDGRRRGLPRQPAAGDGRRGQCRRRSEPPP